MDPRKRIKGIVEGSSAAARRDASRQVERLFSAEGLGVDMEDTDEPLVADPDLVFSMIRSQVMETARLILLHVPVGTLRIVVIQGLQTTMRWLRWSLWKREGKRAGRL